MPSSRRRLHLLVEGQTEETVVRDVVEPYLRTRGFWVSQSTVVTKRPAGRAWHHGGVTSWRQIERDVRHLLGDSSLDVLTTVIDYYAFPLDAPGMDERPAAGPDERVAHVEHAVAEAIGDRRFMPHLVLHELEAWVFAAAAQLAELRGDPALESALMAETSGAGGPELINEGVETAPSKRLARLCPGYTKTLDGPLVIADLGIERLRACCPHMDAWLSRLGV